MPPRASKQSSSTSNKADEWPVQLYRFTQSEGWQQQQVALQSGQEITAAPRKDCIVIPLLRQKFSLLAEGEDKSCVIRRGHCILLVSRRRIRALMMRFNSLQDCLAFSDRFVELNPPSAPSSNNANTAGTSNSAATQTQQENVVSYVTQLLHDNEFLGLVHKLESYFANTADGAKILEGLEHRNLNTVNGSNQA